MSVILSDTEGSWYSTLFELCCSHTLIMSAMDVIKLKDGWQIVDCPCSARRVQRVLLSRVQRVLLSVDVLSCQGQQRWSDQEKVSSNVMVIGKSICCLPAGTYIDITYRPVDQCNY